MAVLVYAHPDDLVTGQWLPQEPTNAAALIRQASALLRRETRTAVYATDTTGKPTDPAIVEGFRDVVCAQVAAWTTAGIDPAAVTAGTSGAGGVASKALGEQSVSYAGADAAAQRRLWAATHLDPVAADILNGLPLWSGVQVIG